MKTASVSLLLGVCVLLLSSLTVSAVSLHVSPNFQQFFSGSSVSLSCVDDGQTADGWTVKRTRGGHTEDCGAAGSSCTISSVSQSDSAGYWCETSSGQKTDQISINVIDKGVILEIPALPVKTGSDVTLRCRKNNGATVAAQFLFNGRLVGSGPKSEHIITNVQQSDEGLYSCYDDADGNSPKSFLRVRGPPPPQTTPPSVDSPVPPPPSIHPPASSPPPSSIHPPDSSPPPPSSIMVLVVVGLVSVVLLVVVGVLFLCRKLKVSGLFLLTAAGVCVLLLSALTVSPASSVLRIFCHLVVFCPYCISTGLLLSICCSRKTPTKAAVCMEMIQPDGGGQGLDGEDDDVTTEHDL